ncbi:MAG: peptidylprolyl isomerase [Chlamydiales bacterium]
MGDAIKEGDQITINYTGKYEDGSIFDSTEETGPFTFEVGGENVINGINDAVVGMTAGEKKSVEVGPTNAFGDYRDDLIMQVPKENFPEEVNEGDLLRDSETGAQWLVQKVNDDHIVVDGNHPLAGKKLFFEIEVVSVDEAKA